MDFFTQGDNGAMHASGSVATRLIANGMDLNALRPFIGKDGRSYINKLDPKTGKLKAIVTNAPGTLRHEQWRQIDQTVVEVAKPRLQAVGDLRARGLTYNVDAMKTIILSYETVSDVTPATISMDGLRQSEFDRPVYDIANLPIPLIHKDFSFSARQIGVSQHGPNPAPLDTAMIVKSTRRVVEEAENLLIGNVASYYYGGGTVYGYTNFPGRIAYTMTRPTTAGWTPDTTLNDFLSMKQALINTFHRGPYLVYTSSDWEQYLDGNFSATYSGGTLRNRLKEINNIQDIQTLDYLNGFQMLMIQMTSDVITLVVGMDVRTVQWESQGGMEVTFKVMCSLTPWLRQDQNANSGYVHAVAA